MNDINHEMFYCGVNSYRMKMQILITGSGGIIGSHICQLLQDHHPDTQITRFKGDLCNPSEIANHFNAGQNYDVIIHLASMVAVDEVNKNPALAYSINVGGTANLLQAVLKYQTKVPYVFLASSAHSYASKNGPINESDPVGPHSLYGRTKYMSEQLANDICTQQEIPLLIGRIFSFYDPRQKPPFLYPNIMKRLEEEDLSQPFELYGAHSERDISKAIDIAHIIIKLVTKHITGIINIASGNSIKISDFVQSLAYKKLNIIPKGIANSLTADITQLKKVLDDTTS